MALADIIFIAVAALATVVLTGILWVVFPLFGIMAAIGGGFITFAVLIDSVAYHFRDQTKRWYW